MSATNPMVQQIMMNHFPPAVNGTTSPYPTVVIVVVTMYMLASHLSKHRSEAQQRQQKMSHAGRGHQGNASSGVARWVQVQDE